MGLLGACLAECQNRKLGYGDGRAREAEDESVPSAPGRRQAQKLLARIKDESGWRGGNVPGEEENKEAGTKAGAGRGRLARSGLGSSSVPRLKPSNDLAFECDPVISLRVGSPSQIRVESAPFPSRRMSAAARGESQQDAPPYPADPSGAAKEVEVLK